MIVHPSNTALSCIHGVSHACSSSQENRSEQSGRNSSAVSLISMRSYALSAAGAEESALRDGVDMVLRQTRDALAKMGVEEIDPLGQPFDAELHNAVMQGTAEEGEPGTVCMVLQKGYKLGSRVIRHAMVKVVAG